MVVLVVLLRKPKNPKKSRQMTILWSAKNDANIKCNGMKIGTKNPLKEDCSLVGGVTAWYFDGLKMHDSLLLNKVKINQDRLGVTTFSPKTTFQFNKGTFQISVGDKMKFEATLLMMQTSLHRLGKKSTNILD